MSDSSKKIVNKIKNLQMTIVICQGSKCKKNGSQEIRKGVKSHLRSRGLNKVVHICRSQCQGFCKAAPIVVLFPQNKWMTETTEKEVAEEIDAILGKK